MEKENYAIKVNALKYQNSGVMNIKGRRRCRSLQVLGFWGSGYFNARLYNDMDIVLT